MSRLRMSVTRHPTVLYRMVVSSSRSSADRLPSMEAERRASAAPGSRSDAGAQAVRRRLQADVRPMYSPCAFVLACELARLSGRGTDCPGVSPLSMLHITALSCGVRRGQCVGPQSSLPRRQEVGGRLREKIRRHPNFTTAAYGCLKISAAMKTTGVVP